MHEGLALPRVFSMQVPALLVPDYGGIRMCELRSR
jgi:hypothetical protein